MQATRGGEDHSQAVVGDGESEVSLDGIPDGPSQRHRLRNLPKLTATQHDVGGGRSQRGSFEQADADLRRGQGRRIVDAVTDEDDPVPGRLPAVDLLGLVGRGEPSRQMPGPVHSAQEFPGAFRLVARQHPGLHAQPQQVVEGRRHRRPQALADQSHGDRSSVGRDPDPASSSLEPGFQSRVGLRFPGPFPDADAHLKRCFGSDPHAGLDTAGRDGQEVFDCDFRRVFRIRPLKGARHRMKTPGLHGGDDRQPTGPILGLSGGQDIHQTQLGFAQGAGLVEDRQRHRGQSLQGPRIAHHHASGGQGGHALPEAQRGGQSQGARAGHQQHRQTVEEARLPSALEPGPEHGGQSGDQDDREEHPRQSVGLMLGLAGAQGGAGLFDLTDQSIEAPAGSGDPAPHHQLGIFAEPAGQHRVSDAADDRLRLSGQRGLAHETLALDHHAIDRDGFTGQHADAIALDDVVDRDPNLGRPDPTGRGEGVSEATGLGQSLFTGPGCQSLAGAVDRQQHGHHLVVHRAAAAQARQQRGPEGSDDPGDEQELEAEGASTRAVPRGPHQRKPQQSEHTQRQGDQHGVEAGAHRSFRFGEVDRKADQHGLAGDHRSDNDAEDRLPAGGAGRVVRGLRPFSQQAAPVAAEVRWGSLRAGVPGKGPLAMRTHGRGFRFIGSGFDGQPGGTVGHSRVPQSAESPVARLNRPGRSRRRRSDFLSAAASSSSMGTGAETRT